MSNQDNGQIDLANLPPLGAGNKSGNTLSGGCIILAIVAGVFILVVPCIIIVVLALLGPAIGNIFSNIVINL